jgi:predicted Zn-dependent protease
MAEKSPRRRMLEESLASDPTDAFLRYGLAVQCLREGDIEEGRTRLQALIADHPDDQVAAHQQLGQSYLESGETEQARAMLRDGIALARRRGDSHAASEMEGLLAGIG